MLAGDSTIEVGPYQGTIAGVGFKNRSPAAGYTASVAQPGRASDL